MSLGTQCASIAASVISRFGETVTIRRRSSTPGGVATDTTAVCMVVPLDPEDYAQLRVEGILNVQEGELHYFIFASTVDIAEATDTIIHDSEHYRVVMQDEQMMSGSKVVKYAVGVRQ